MAKLKLPFELEKPDSASFVTRTSEIGHNGLDLDVQLNKVQNGVETINEELGLGQVTFEDITIEIESGEVLGLNYVDGKFAEASSGVTYYVIPYDGKLTLKRTASTANKYNRVGIVSSVDKIAVGNDYNMVLDGTVTSTGEKTDEIDVRKDDVVCVGFYGTTNRKNTSSATLTYRVYSDGGNGKTTIQELKEGVNKVKDETSAHSAILQIGELGNAQDDISPSSLEDIGMSGGSLTDNTSAMVFYMQMPRTGILHLTRSTNTSTAWNRVGKVASIAAIKVGGTYTPILDGFSGFGVTKEDEFDVQIGDVIIVGGYGSGAKTPISAKLYYTSASATSKRLDSMELDIANLRAAVGSGGSNYVPSTNEGSANPFAGKKIVVFGDSSTDNSMTKWTSRMGSMLGATMYLQAKSGNTWRNKISNGVLEGCVGAQIEKFLEKNVTPDIIMFQLGGNDIGGSFLGTAESAFASYNYMTLKNDNTTYGCMRYWLEHMRRLFPSALITVGTVFQRMGNMDGDSAKDVNDIIHDVCKRLCIQIIDGEKYLGFSAFTEANRPYYCDLNPGDTNNRTGASRTYPIYNFIKVETGEAVLYDEATNNGVLKEGYIKRYGLYTYDGKHQTQAGEDKVTQFMYNAILSLGR